MTPRITIIIPTYNRATIVPRAIDSVLAQTFTDWELVIVDDGSTDNTAEVVNGYGDPRIHLVRHSRNLGVTAAHNTGYDHMHGEFFTSLGSDDELKPNTLSRMAAVLDSHSEVDALICNGIVAETGRPTGYGLDAEGPIDESTVVMTGDFWSLNRSSTLGEQRLDPDLKGFEEVLWYELAERQSRYFIPDQLLVVHYDAGDRVTQQGRGYRYESFATLLETHPDHVERLLRKAPEVRARFWFDAGIEFAWVGDGERARLALRELRASGAAGTLRNGLLSWGVLAGPKLFRPSLRFALWGRSVARGFRKR